MGRGLQTRRSTPPGRAVGGAGRKTSAAEVEPPQARRASKKSGRSASGLSWCLNVHVGASGHAVAVVLCKQ